MNIRSGRAIKWALIGGSILGLVSGLRDFGSEHGTLPYRIGVYVGASIVDSITAGLGLWLLLVIIAPKRMTLAERKAAVDEILGGAQSSSPSGKDS